MHIHVFAESLEIARKTSQKVGGAGGIGAGASHLTRNDSKTRRGSENVRNAAPTSDLQETRGAGRAWSFKIDWRGIRANGTSNIQRLKGGIDPRDVHRDFLFPHVVG